MANTKDLTGNKRLEFIRDNFEANPHRPSEREQIVDVGEANQDGPQEIPVNPVEFQLDDEENHEILS